MIEHGVSTLAEPDVLQPGGVATTGVLVVAWPDRMDAHHRAVETIGARVLGAVAPPMIDERLRDQIGLDAILLDLTGSDADSAGYAARAAAAWAADRDCRIVAILDSAAIDLVAPPLMDIGAALLCDAAPGDHAAALAAALSPPATRFHDATREREAERLRQLNEEVARLAEVLSELVAENRAPAVRDSSPGYQAGPASESDPDPRIVRSVIRARRLRDQHFPAELFADPAWDMLLDLYAARLESRRVSVSSLCIAAAVPPTTALRWIGTMHDAGLFGREADPNDKRRAHIRLNERALAAMRGYFAAAGRAGVIAV